MKFWSSWLAGEGERGAATCALVFGRRTGGMKFGGGRRAGEESTGMRRPGESMCMRRAGETGVRAVAVGEVKRDGAADLGGLDALVPGTPVDGRDENRVALRDARVVFDHACEVAETKQ